MDFATYVRRLAHELGADQADADFTVMIPEVIDYAELRIYRDLDLINQNITEQSALTINSKSFTATNTFIGISTFQVFTPSGAVPATGTSSVLLPVSREYIDFAWPTNVAATTPSVPTVFARFGDKTFVVGPPPDAAYAVTISGTVRPTLLSATNTTDFISENLPDLLIAASLCYLSKDQNKAAQWEAQYQALKAGAMVDEVRKKYQSTSWSAQQPPAIATPTRT